MRTRAALIVVALLMAPGCTGAIDPAGPPDLDGVGATQFSLEAQQAAHDTIMVARPRATQLMVEHVNLTLAKHDILGTVVKDVEQRLLSPLTDGQPPATCPYLTKVEQANTVSCRFLVDTALTDALVSSGTLQDTIEQEVEEEHGAVLRMEELRYVKAWAGEAVLSGIDVGAVHAADILREQGVCDQAPTPSESAFALGEQQGKALLENTEDEVLPTVPNTICNTDVVANTVLTEAANRVEPFVQSHPVCAGYAPSTLAVQVDLAQAEQNRRAGLEEGIREAYEALRVRLVNTWVCQQPPTGDPLVVDLDGHGIRFADTRAAFDLAATGERALMPVPARGSALLGIDLDGNGRIDSGAELFSNASSCGAHRCLDGIQALAAFDENRDGVIDGRDPAFRRLRLWRDADADGRSSPGELASLDAAGIRAIGLAASLDRGFADAAGNASLRSLTFERTDGTAGAVHDVWFSLRFRTAPEDPRTSGIVSSLDQRY